MKIKASLDNITYDLLYTPKNNCKFYKPLLTALWSKLTENQKHKVIIINPNNPEQKIINFDDMCIAFNKVINIQLNVIMNTRPIKMLMNQ